MEKANVIYNYQLFYFWAFCPIRLAVLPHRWGKTPILHLRYILHILDYNEKRYKVVMHYVWKGN